MEDKDELLEWRYSGVHIFMTLAIAVIIMMVTFSEMIANLVFGEGASLVVLVGACLIGALIAYEFVRFMSWRFIKGEGLVNYMIPNILFTIIAIPYVLEQIPQPSHYVLEVIQLLYLGIPTLAILFGYKYITVVVVKELEKNQYIYIFKALLGVFNVMLLCSWAFSIYVDLLENNPIMKEFLSNSFNLLEVNILDWVFVQIIPNLIFMFHGLRFLLHNINEGFHIRK